MMYKESTFSSFTPTGEPLMHVLSNVGSPHLEKTAGIHPEVLKFKQMLEPEPNKTYVHILALGAGDFYGANLNNDYFPWCGLSHDSTTTPHKYPHGYKTFLNAHSFAHHVNKDPAKSYGDVILSTLNNKMKRVELVVAIDHERCEKNGGAKTLQKIHDGEYPSTSMGCRVPYDRCSICGNHARTRAEYCEHMKLMPGKILDDGRKVFVYNDYPRFFDISFVFIGADRTSFVLEKIANRQGIFVPPEYALVKEAGSRLSKTLRNKSGVKRKNTQMRVKRKIRQKRLTMKPITFSKLETSMRRSKRTKGSNLALHSMLPNSQLTLNTGPTILLNTNAKGGYEHSLSKVSALKEAEHAKLSDIFKRVNSLPMGKAVPMRVGREQDLPRDMLDSMGCRDDLGSTLGDLGSAGIVLKPKEFQRVALVHMGRRNLADDLDDRGAVFRPRPATRMIRIRISPRPSSSLMSSIKPMLEERSTLGPIAIRRTAVLSARPLLRERGTLDEGSLDKLSSAYSGYRRDLLTNLEDITRSAMAAPEITGLIRELRGDEFRLSDNEMHVLYMLPLAYFSSAYWNSQSLGCGDASFIRDFARKNPTISKYLATLVASRSISSIL
ncbi:MAG: hypothetical protein VXZ72_00035 [Chlamydiota bacterium]|nr:hypothetical protein [Chlamydiota bacterium]